MNKLSKNAILLLLCLLINVITSTFIYTYLLAFILDVSNNGIINVALFYLVVHLTMIVLSWIIAPMLKRFNKTSILRAGIVFKFLFVIMVVYLGADIAKHIYIVAICNGFSESMFWGASNPLQTIVNEKTSLTTYVSYFKTYGIIIGLTIPIIMGYYIDKIGLSVISIVMIFIVTTQLILSLFLNEKTDKNNTKTQYKEFVKEATTSFPQIKHIYKNQFIYGFYSNLSMIVLYYTFITFGSNVSLGIFSTISSILSIVVISIYNLKKEIWSKYIFSILCSIAVSASIITLAFYLNKITLILFYSFWQISNTVSETITSATRLNITTEESLKKYHVENITISEFILNFGRVTGEVLLLIMGIICNQTFDIVCLCIVAIIVAIYYIHTCYLNKNNADVTTSVKNKNH